MSRRGKNAANRHERRRISSSEPPKGIEFVALALILLSTLVVYWPSIHGEPLWDDDEHITAPRFQSWQGLSRIWFEFGATEQYYPLVHTAFWLQHRLWGDNPSGYHAVGLICHLISAVLVYVIIKRLKIPGALLAAAIFALHPVMVESVAWITQQKNTVSALFYLSSLLVYLYFDKSRLLRTYFTSLGLFVLAILAKSAVVTLPAALLVIFWWQRGTVSWRRDVLPLVPFFVAAALMGIVTCHVEWNHVGTAGADFAFAPAQRFLLAGRAVWFYLGKLFWPENLIFIYPRWELDPSQWWQWIYPIAAIATAAALWGLRKRSRAPLAGWLFFCGTLLPVLGLLNQYLFIYTFVSDHFQYVAALGVIVPAAAAFTLVQMRLTGSARASLAALSVMLVAVLAVKSWRQCHMYTDVIALFRTTIERNPDCWMARNNLAAHLITKGKSQEAIEHCRAVLRVKPDDPKAHNNLATALLDLGRLEESIDHFSIAIRLLPDYFDAHRNLSNALLNAGRLPEALDEARAAATLRPHDPIALNRLGVVLMQMGRLDEATVPLERSVALLPDDAGLRNNLGAALLTSGKIPQAIEHLRHAVSLNPSHAGAQVNLGLALAANGDFQEAIRHLEKAIQLGADASDVRTSLADSYRQTGQTERAIEHYKAAINLSPDDAQAYLHLLQVLATANRSDEAITLAQKGIDVARAARQESAAAKLEEWLKHYQNELRRTEAAPRR